MDDEAILTHVARVTVKQKPRSLLEQIEDSVTKVMPKTPPTVTAVPVVGEETVPEASELPASDKLTALPSAASAYKAHSRPDNKPLATLRVVLGDGTVKGFQYANIDHIDLVPSNKPASGPVVTLRFAGIHAEEVRIEGRNLDLLYDWLCYHRISWIWMLPPGKIVADPKAAVITRITPAKLDD